MNRHEKERTTPRPDLAIRRAVAEEEEGIAALAAASGRDGGHARVRGFLADASPPELLALRHLLTCPLCRQLACVVLLDIPALELPGAGSGHPRRRQRRHPLRHRS